ncbi:MAG: type I-E CRISPR-associated protein Cse1/CasA [Methylococcaceae bacterium]|nr:type I-E CRISPR-associated protein Cse1/CasA [Methylococcaceae bacterium]
MPFNLLNERFLPILRANGAKERIAPWEITDGYADDPIVALDAARPDFNGGALIQFLIGLLQTAFAPKDSLEWEDRMFGQPPSPEELKAAFARYQNAFNLDGDGPRFMQDFDPLTAQKPIPITALLIDTAGSETHFIKNLPQQGFSPALAAMALYSLQTNAPAGGVGHRTSLRGGGPLTTLVVCAPDDPMQPATLWQTLWLNVLEASHFKSSNNRPEDIFPWLALTRTSEKNSKTEFTTRVDVNPLQMFWGMPRRTRLDFEDVGGGECGLSGEQSDILVRQYRTKNYGMNYSGIWGHALSPHNRSAEDSLPVHAKGQINYRHWLGLVQINQDKKIQRVPAATVQRFWKQRLHREGFRFRLWVFGYDMDNMKPRCWYEATLPLFQVEETQRESFEATIKHLIDAAGLFLGNLRSCLKDAWFSDGDPRRSGADTGFLDAAFWSDTETDFYGLLEQLRPDPGNNDLRKKLSLAWHGILNGYTLKTFDRYANTSQITDQNPRRIAAARRNLMRFNYKKDIKNLLDMPATPKNKA